MRAAVYATREQVKTALDSAETARNNRRIDRCIRAASDAVERLTLRKFYPVVATREFDWPDYDITPQAWSLWLDENELAAPPTAVSSGGDAINPGHVLAYPAAGPPYNELQMDLGQSSAWSSGVSRQNAISVTGVFGYRLDEARGPLLAANIADTFSTSIDIAASAEVGVGSLLRIGDERMNVLSRSMLTTGQTLTLQMDAAPSSQILQVASTAGFTEDEVVMVDAERMRVEDIAGATRLIVRRAWDGSTLAAHTGGATVFAARRLQVERGACGTTGATHTAGDVVWVFQPPDLINQLTIAEAQVQFYAESTGYARTVGSGDNEREAAGRQVESLRKRVLRGFYRVRNF